jgi:transcriptional regulator with XRE-family HTH domain
MSDVTKMIKNDRQYRITKSQAEKFRQALHELENSGEELHPIQKQARLDAIASQLDELQFQIAEYEALLSGETSILELHSFEEISDALIKSRIASGMSQKELADKLGLKEQQVQRYEATGYKTASIEKVSEIIKALGISVREEIFLPTVEISFRKLFDQLIRSGIDGDLVIRRILPKDIELGIQGNPEETK